MGTRNSWLQDVQAPIAGVLLSHLTTLRFRRGMKQFPTFRFSPPDAIPQWGHRLGILLSRVFLPFLLSPRFVSTASAADGLRSGGGSKRRSPVCSSQGWLGAARQVGQRNGFWRLPGEILGLPHPRASATYCSWQQYFSGHTS